MCSISIRSAKHFVQSALGIPERTAHRNPELAETRGADGDQQRRNRFEAKCKILEALID
jgi:hypothetical protein